MKKIYKILILIIILGLLFVLYKYNKENNIEQLLPAEESQEMLIETVSLPWEQFKTKSQELNTVVIDIRSPKETAGGKIFSEAMEINFYEPDFEHTISNLDHSKTYLVYCQSGKRSKKSLDIFQKYGLEAYDLIDGYNGTIEKQLE